LSGWGDLAKHGDEELVDLLIGTSIPERADGQAVLFEVFRERFKDVPMRAFRQAVGSAAIEEDFLGWFWHLERLGATLAAYRRSRPRGAFAGYLFVKAKWLVRDYFRHRNRQPKVQPLVVEVPARGGGLPDDDPLEVPLASVRDCIERLGPTARVPFKLVHVAAVDLSDEDLAILERKAGRTRADLDRALEAHRRAGRQLTLAEVGALMNMKLHTVGTYVARAQQAIRACVRRKAGREGPS